MPINIRPLSDDDIQSQLRNEENTKRTKITPVILDRWQGLDADKVIMENYFTDGRISVDEYKW